MNCRYWCFLSYSHKDEAVARWLARAIEGFRVPRQLVGVAGREGELVPKLVRPVFRDRDELPASADLGATLRLALEASRVLVVLCSPDAARSRWVEEEILSFKRRGLTGRILAVIVRGRPNAANAEEECFPEALRFALLPDGSYDRAQMAEPIAADLTADAPRDVLLRVIAGVLGIPFDNLKQRHRARQKKQRLMLALAVTLLLGAFAGLWWWKEDEAQRAARAAALHLAEQQRQNEAASLREAGRAAMTGGDPSLAMAPLLASLEKVPEDEETLLLAGGVAHEVKGLQRVLRGHTAEISKLAVSHDETWLASVGIDGRVLVWEVATGRERFRIEGGASPTAEFAAAQFSPDGRFLLISRTWHQGAVLLDLTTGTRQEVPGEAQVVMWTADHRLFLLRTAASGDTGCALSWWDPKEKKETAGPSLPLKTRLQGWSDAPCRTAVITGLGADGERWFWLELDAGRIIASGKTHSGSAPGDPTLAADGTKLIVLGEQGWELHRQDGQVVKLAAMVPVQEGSLLQRGVTPIEFDFADDGRFLVSANQGATATIWDSGGRALKHLDTRGIVTATADPHLPRAVLRDADGHLSVISLPDGRVIGEMHDTIAGVATDMISIQPPSPVVLSGKGSVAVAAKSKAIKLWSIAELDKTAVPLSATAALGITSVEWSSEGRRLLVTQHQNRVSWCDPDTHAEVVQWRIAAHEGGSADGGMVMKDGRVLILNEGGQPSVWTPDGRPDASWPQKPAAVSSDPPEFDRGMKRAGVILSDAWLRGGLPPLQWGDRVVYAGRGSEELSVFDGKEVRRLALPKDALLRDVTTSAGLLIAGDHHGTLSVWSTDTDRPVRHLQCADRALRRIALSPAGTVAAVLTDGGEVALWSLSDGSRLQSWQIDQSISAHDLCFADDGRRIAVACADGQVRVFEQGAADAIAALSDARQPAPDRQLLPPSLGFSRPIRGATVLAPSPDHRLLAAGFDHGCVIVWSALSLQPVLRVACDGVSALRFSPKGDQLAVGMSYGRVLILPIKAASTEDLQRLTQLRENAAAAER